MCKRYTPYISFCGHQYVDRCPKSYASHELCRGNDLQPITAPLVGWCVACADRIALWAEIESAEEDDSININDDDDNNTTSSEVEDDDDDDDEEYEGGGGSGSLSEYYDPPSSSTSYSYPSTKEQGSSAVRAPAQRRRNREHGRDSDGDDESSTARERSKRRRRSASPSPSPHRGKARRNDASRCSSSDDPSGVMARGVPN